MKLYNTLSRKVEEIKPDNPPLVKMYTCGPTVYDYPHIGNWFTFLRYDILVRTLKAAGFEPKWVMNITDVGHLTSDADEGEDKLEKGARREGKTAWEVAQFYTDYFMRSLKRLNITPPDMLPKATDHITEQIDLVKKLEEKGFTYTIKDGVYFDTSKLKDYGKLAKLDIEHLKEGARVEANPEKRNPTDFALWKLTPKDQKRDMEWDSPWGNGFPGWHLECSAMSMKYLGETLDIHGGGIDHIPVHHTNEIAQSEAVTGESFSRYWFHSNFILVNSQKMAKSKGNFYTLEDLEEKGVPPMAFRLLALESHYRSEAEFNWNILSAAHNRLKAYQAMADLRWQPKEVDRKGEEQMVVLITETVPAGLLEAVNDDLNTPMALATLSQLENAAADGLHAETIELFNNLLEIVDGLLGLGLLLSKDITDEQKKLIKAREKAREAKDWEASDKLRDKLLNQDIAVRDTANGPIWSRL